MHQLYDFGINASLLWVFRPRQWPEYFNLGILDEPLMGVRGDPNHDSGEQRVIAPINQATIKPYNKSQSFSDISFTSG